ncbi:CinA family protein [Altererythrobacter sp. CC-YST694]|uniref:CinA family protein n=1 Tax=Altererythrobacter sp. CC-YST694 TaxID=2755038 RepID=UPI001D00A974|nr:nicotinamide-nucleotide amidohydrolase family protein [Altererythrobacter sp. CC-YST694]MCB5425176.1 CinA family protein [Altererythrobacter sp. CC-YST694]
MDIQEPLQLERNLSQLAEDLLQAAVDRDFSVASAESCTGGLIASTLTGIEGLSSAFSSGFVTYSDEAKTGLLGIPMAQIDRYGAVSPQIALAMARRALAISDADVAVAVSGYTGPAGGHENGLVHVAARDRAGQEIHGEFHLGEVERNEGRQLAAAAALRILHDAILKAGIGGGASRLAK